MIKAGQELIITSSASSGKEKSENAEKSGQKAEWN